MTTVQNTTQDISVKNGDLEILQKYFSHCFDKAGKFDFGKFKKELAGNEVDFSRESYGMDWLGKSYARLLASDSAKTLLKEDKIWNEKAENKNSENLLLKGDNLEILKHLSNAYHEKVKMIYIDPPYNTGSDGFVYSDDRKFSVEQFGELAGVDEEKAKKILSFVSSKSNSHSAWLTFMYPRLYIAKQLLKDDGVIFVSIDDNEVAQLRLLMDEIFGEENFVAEIINIVKTEGRRYGSFAKTHEYILCYKKNINNELNQLEREDEFKLEDEIGKYRLTDLRNQNTRAFNKTNRPNLCYPFYISTEKIADEFLKVATKKNEEFDFEVYPIKIDDLQSVWRWGLEKSSENEEKNLIARKGSDGMFRIYQKYRCETIMPKTVWHDKNFISIRGTKELQELFNGNTYFDFPKPVELIKNFLKIGSNDDDLILDFFAGSGTTGDAVMQLNTEDKANGKEGNRKYILVQLPEKIDAKKNKTAYDFVKNELGVAEPTIFEITKERLIRAGKKILKQVQNDNGLDLGFKIFETMPIWEDYEFSAKEFEKNLQLFDESKLTEQDIETLLTTWKTYDGIALTEPLEKIDLGGYAGHYFGAKLYLIAKGFQTKNLKKLLEELDENNNFSPASIVVFGYHFDSKNLREIAENVASYANKKKLEIDFVTRY